jgi:hypothetical protein
MKIGTGSVYLICRHILFLVKVGDKMKQTLHMKNNIYFSAHLDDNSLNIYLEEKYFW